MKLIRKERSVWRRALFYIKWKRPEQLRQANVPKRKKGGLPFILFGLFDPEELGAATGLDKKWIAEKWCQGCF
ncbi:hypothetical protein [Rossellomorea vietnamensis]|uniref:hypothetical protein n=1 Tax=Rossellomorea vietnamensis TaxID=218284 RepID=UPI003CF9BB9F